MSTQELICEFCGKLATSKGNLKRHQLSKKCLDSQSEKGVRRPKTYIDLYNDVIRLTEENDKLIEEVAILKNENKDVELLRNELGIYKQLYVEHKEESKIDQQDTKKILTQLASKPTVSNTQNNVFNNLTPLDLSEERIKKALPNYTMPYYLRGPAGMADFLTENLLTDEKGNSMYACNDKNRCYFQYKDMSGAKINDIRCQQLIAKVKPYLQPRIAAFKKERDDWIMEKYGDDDEAYAFNGGGSNLITKKQLENHGLTNHAFDIAKFMVLRHK